MRAYVLIDAGKNESRKIVSKLRRKPGVIVADMINGPHPVITCIEGDTPSSIAQMILFDIRKIEGVNDLTVYLCTDEARGIGIEDNFPDSLLPLFPENTVSSGSSRRRKKSNKVNGWEK